MRYRLLLIALVFAMSICLVGCQFYQQEDADRVAEKGAQMMQAWLDENMPDAQMIECAAFITNIRYSSREYLFDYATGRIVSDGEERVFAIDTLTGDVYFQSDPEEKERLNKIAADFLYETMGIVPEGSDDFFSCYVLAPFRDENHELKAYIMDYGFDFGLPAGVENLEAFVRNPATRPWLWVVADITLPDETDLAAYDFDAFEKLGQECGMLFSSICVENSTQTSKRVIRDWGTDAGFYEYGQWIEKDGVYFTGYVRVRDEKRDDLTGEMTVSDRRFDPQKDLVWEETDGGYGYYLPSEDWNEGFRVYAREGARMLEYNYRYYFCDDIAEFAAGEYDPEEEGTELVWKKLSGGDYALVSKKDGASKYFTHAGMLERDLG